MPTPTFKGKPVPLAGTFPTVGSSAPAFCLTRGDLSTATLATYSDRVLILSVFPSIDTGTCATSVRKFNQEAAALSGVRILAISADLPFAQGRFCAAEGIKAVETLSAFRSPNFGRDYGLLVAEGPMAGLLTRAVLVLDAQRKIVHAELVAEITREPDYAAALAAARTGG